MSNSRHVNYQKLSPNYSSRNGNKIKKITIHHMAGNLSIETCANVFASRSAGASSNYGVGTDGRIGLYVEEVNRAWTSSNYANDAQAVTIEVANDSGMYKGGNWHVSDKALESTIKLCVDICQRNNISKLKYTGDASGNLTMHCFFANTDCPGPYLKSKFSYIATEVNKRLESAKAAAKTTSTSTTQTKNTIEFETQSGAFKSKENADALNKKMHDRGFDTVVRKVGDTYKVMSGGPYKTKAEAEARCKVLKAKGFDSIVTTRVVSK